ncbi:MAG TPA: hypothetical protein ENH65_07025 [Candidatus Aminicenantes bacterium]|nr:hypothetical protein [Candidatus Aminicenantes bacterium]
MCFLIWGMDGKVCRYQAVGTAHQKRGENRSIWLDAGFLVLVIAKMLIAILTDVNRFSYETFPDVSISISVITGCYVRRTGFGK